MYRKIIQLFVTVVLIFSGWTQPVLAAPNASDINPVSLPISTDELAQISVSFHENSFQTSDDTVKLTSRGSILVSSNKTIQLSAVEALLSSLHDLYPVPRIVTWRQHTTSRDNPYEQIILKLKDGRQVVAESTSQFPKGVPWNIRVWQGEAEKSNLLGSYVLFNENFYTGANEMWKALTGDDFPRKAGPAQFSSDPTQNTGSLDFYVPKPGDDFTKYADQAQVSGLPVTALEPFLPGNYSGMNSYSKTLPKT